MSLKEHVSQKVQKIANEGKAVDEKVADFVKEDFHKTLVDCEKNGHTVKQITIDMLEGVQAGLKAAGHRTGDIVAESAAAIVDVTYDIAVQTLDAVRSYADDAYALLNRAVNKSFEGMDNMEARTRTEMEKAYAALQRKTATEKQKLHEVGEGIKAYAENKTHELTDATRRALHSRAEKSRAHLQALTEASEAHSKKLFHHSYEKVAKWMETIKMHHNA